MLGTLPIGLKTKKQIRTALQTISTTPIRLQVNNRIYTYYYRDIGVYVNADQTLKEIFSPTTHAFPFGLFAFIKALFTQRVLPPSLSFTQDFEEFVQKTVYDFSVGDDIILFNQEEKRMTLYQQEERFGLDPVRFKSYIQNSFGSSIDPLIPPLTPIATDTQHKVKETNTKLTDVFSRALTVIMRVNNADQFFTINENDLQKYIEVDVQPDTNAARFIPSDILLDIYTSRFVVANDQNSLKQRLASAIENALQTRFNGYVGESVHVNVDSGPNSDGSLAKRYIEIDISQQRLYTFKDGVEIKSYRVSTGKDYPTPTGTFEILNKTGLGFSTIYNVWMPYWMGFNYSEKLHAYFGIHELPYYYSAGNKIQRPRDFIGVPNTGGCVALDVGDAKEVYKFADIGTKIVIYP